MTIGSLPRTCFFFRLLGLCLVGAVFLTLGCSQSEEGAAKKKKYDVADDEPSESLYPKDGSTAAPPTGVAPEQPPFLSGSELGAASVPDGTPQELLTFIDQMFRQANQLRQQDQPMHVMRAEAMSVFDRILVASEKILAATDADLQIRRNAIAAWVQSIQILSQIDPTGDWSERVRVFARQLAADASPKIAIQGRTILFGLRIGEVSQGRDKDIDGLLAELKSLLADENRDLGVQDSAQQAVLALQMLGRQELANETLRMVAEAYKDHPDAEAAAESANMFEHLDMIELGIDDKLKAVAEKQEGAEAAFVEAITEVLNRPKLGAVVLEKAISAAGMLEQIGDYALGLRLCQMIQEAYKEHEDPGLKADAARITQSAVTRMNLIGKPLVVQGTGFGGSKFDFAKYKGKVVLVAFWAVLDERCADEIENVRTNYAAYHSKGFEVISVNLDRDADALGRALVEKQFPWATITNDALVRECGADIIPFLVLLDAEGIVRYLHVRGAALQQRLAELLGPPAVAAPADGADPASSPPQQPVGKTGS